MKKTVKVVAVAATALVLLAGCATTDGAKRKPESWQSIWNGADDDSEKPSGTTSGIASEKKSEKKTAKETSKKDSSSKSKKTAKKAKYDQSAFEKAYKSGDFETCIDMLETRGSDTILAELDSSMLQFLRKEYMSSAREFVQTQADMQQVSKDMTAGKVMEAALVGENSVTYSGAVYERILAYSMKAVNAFKMGRVDSAVGVMNEYTGNYKDEITALVQQQKEIARSSEGMINDPKVKSSLDVLEQAKMPIDLGKVPSAPAASESPVYEVSPFLAFLGTLAYASNGDAVHAKDFASVLGSTKAKVDVSEDLSVPAGKGRLDVIALSDTIGKRTDAGQLVSMCSWETININFKLAYPEFKEQNHPISVSKVTLSNGETKPFVLIEDFDEAVRNDVESKASGAFYRSLFRNITKNAAAVATGIAALKTAEELKSKASNPIQKKAAATAYNKAVQGLNAGFTAVVDAEKADIRQGSFFPNKASAAGFTVEPGTYTVTVEYSNGKKDVIQNVAVAAGKPTVVVSDCMN